MSTKDKVRFTFAGILIFVLLIILVVWAGQNANAQELQPHVVVHNSPEDVVSWWKSHNLPQTGLRALSRTDMDIVSAYEAQVGCEHTVWNRNQSHTGPLSNNSSEVLKFETNFCEEKNELFMTGGTDWWGYQGLSQHFWALIVMRDASTDLFLKAWTIDVSNVPDVDLQALLEEIPAEAFTLNHGQVRVIFDGNVQMEGSSDIANKVVEVLVTPNPGKVELIKGGNVLIDSVFELIRVKNDGTAELVGRITIRPYHIQRIDGEEVAVLTWDDLSGPVNANGGINYYLQERIDLSPTATPKDPNTGEHIWPVWEISLDASHQLFTAEVDNVSFKVYLPIILNSKGGTTPPVCPVDVVDVKLNGAMFRSGDDFSTTGLIHSLRTLHLNESIEIDMTKLSKLGLVPNSVQLWLDNKPYGHYDSTAGIFRFYTGWKYDEQNGFIGPFRMYVFHAEVPVNGTSCLYKLFIYIDP